MAEYREKIRKLLALAESPNENEAKAALLRARELMAKHKLTEADCVEMAKRKVKRIKTEFTFTKRREPWTLDLAGVIAEHYCCTSLLNHEYGKRTYAHLFVGLENDVEVCAEVFGYAMRFVYSRVKDIRRELKGFPTSYVRYECDNYGYGFADGLKNEFERQRGEHREWALVMVKPPEVVADTEGLKTKMFTSDKDTGGASYAEGFKEGGEFTPEKSLKGHANDALSKRS